MATETLLIEKIKRDFLAQGKSFEIETVTVNAAFGASDTTYTYDFGADNHDRFYLLTDSPNAVTPNVSNVSALTVEAPRASMSFALAPSIVNTLQLTENIGEYFDSVTVFSITKTNPGVPASVALSFLRVIPCPIQSCNQ